MRTKPDFLIRWDGSKLYLVRAMTPAGDQWVEEHLDPGGLTWGLDHVVEDHYLYPVLDAITNDGLSFEMTGPAWA